MKTCDDGGRASLRGFQVRTTTIAVSVLTLFAVPQLTGAQPTAGEDSQRILTIDHYVPNRSIVRRASSS